MFRKKRAMVKLATENKRFFSAFYFILKIKFANKE